MPEKTIKRVVLLNILFILLFRPVQAQTLSNLEVLYRLSDSAVVKIAKNLPVDSKDILLKTSLAGSYSVFENRVINAFRQQNKVVSLKDDKTSPALLLTIDRAKISYPDIFKNGLFGSYKLKREASLHGSYTVTESGVVKTSGDFSFFSTDTVEKDAVKEIEDITFPFTRAEVPSEPFFSTILEPVVALGTAAAVIYLFFTVRSK